MQYDYSNFGGIPSGGKQMLFGFFVGQVMKAMAGKANPGVINELLKKALCSVNQSNRHGAPRRVVATGLLKRRG
jgi:hypothetical protein